jgi:hypothetical protein
MRLLLCLLAVGCASAPETTSTVIDSAGVSIASYDGPDRPLEWRFVPEFRLGGDDEGLAAFYRVTRNFVGADAAGRVYVLDPPGRHVIEFDTAGVVLRTLGRRGQGPGELGNPASIAVRPDGGVAVFDYSRFGLVTFKPDGEPGPVHRLGSAPPSFVQPHFAPWGDGWLVLASRPGVGGGVTNALLQLTAADTSDIATLSMATAPMVTYPTCEAGLSLPPVFAPEIVWAASPTRAAVASGADYRVELHSLTGERGSVRRLVTPLSATSGLAERELGEGFRVNFGDGPCTIPSGEMVEGRGFESVVPTIANLTIAPDGSLWVERRRVAGDSLTRIDIFDPQGEYLGTLLGQPMPAVFLSDTRVGWVETDSAGVQQLVVGRIEGR